MKKGLKINHSYDIKFVRLLEDLVEKYGDKIFSISGIGDQLDINCMSKRFFTNATTPADVSSDPNSNVGDKSIIAYSFEISKPYLLLNSYYRLWKWLWKNRGVEYANKIIEMQISGDIYINDFHSHSSGKSYCFNFSTYDTALKGIPKELDSKGSSLPPQYLMAFKEQLVLFCLLAGNSVAGAVGLSDLLIVISLYFQRILDTMEDAHFQFRDTEACWYYLEATLTSLIYTLNQPYRGNESLFTNVSVYDKNFLSTLCPSYTLELKGVMYVAKPELVSKIQNLFLDIMNKELERRVLTYPIVSACLSTDQDNNILDEKFLDEISEKDVRYGFINIFSGKTSTHSSCCRLRSDDDNEYFNSYGSGSSKIGSASVSTVNLPRLAYKNKDNKDKFFEELKQLVIDCQEVNNAKRNIIKRTIKDGYAPLYSLGYMDLKRQYSTLGVNGFYECIKTMGYNILEKEGQEFGLDILKTINYINDGLQKRFKAPHNTEQVPGETLSIKLAEKDKLLGYNNEYELYSNQFIPLTSEANILDRMSLQGLLDGLFSGGSILHLNISKQIGKDKIKNLIKASVKQGVVYQAINYIVNKCGNCGEVFVGELSTCTKCGSDSIEKYTRVVGFMTKISNFHKVRREFDVPYRKFVEV